MTQYKSQCHFPLFHLLTWSWYCKSFENVMSSNRFILLSRMKTLVVSVRHFLTFCCTCTSRIHLGLHFAKMCFTTLNKDLSYLLPHLSILIDWSIIAIGPALAHFCVNVFIVFGFSDMLGCSVTFCLIFYHNILEYILTWLHPRKLNRWCELYKVYT